MVLSEKNIIMLNILQEENRLVYIGIENLNNKFDMHMDCYNECSGACDGNCTGSCDHNCYE